MSRRRHSVVTFLRTVQQGTRAPTDPVGGAYASDDGAEGCSLGSAGPRRLAAVGRGYVVPVRSPRDVDAGWLVGAFGAVVLLISLFLDWYDIGITGWNAFETWDAVLAAVAALVLASALPTRVLPFAVPGQVLGTVAVGVVVLHLLNPPPAATGAGPDVGAWLALLGAVAVLAGELLSRARVSVAVQTRSGATRVVPEQRAGRP